MATGPSSGSSRPTPDDIETKRENGGDLIRNEDAMKRSPQALAAGQPGKL